MIFTSHDETFVSAVATERLVIRNHKIMPL